MPEKEMHEEDRGCVWREFGRELIVTFVMVALCVLYLFGDEGMRFLSFAITTYVAADEVAGRILWERKE